MTNRGNLYICPTPIGNLKDMTFRAVELLKSVDLVLCEDTRTSSKLLNHYEITTQTQSYHKFNEKQSAEKIIALIEQGQNIALISDAGTPIISDPGSELLKCAIEHNINIIPLAGASAVTTFMSGVYNPGGHFLFIGFLPKKQTEKEEILQKNRLHTTVFYESPNRLTDTLNTVAKIFPYAEIAVGRELTKVYEEIRQGQIEDILAHYTNNPPKGEIAVAIIAPQDVSEDFEIEEKIRKLHEQNYGVGDISKILSTLFGVSKNAVYKIATQSIKK